MNGREPAHFAAPPEKKSVTPVAATFRVQQASGLDDVAIPHKREFSSSTGGTERNGVFAGSQLLSATLHRMRQ